LGEDAPRADRIDELADFLEWFANAKPEDEKALRREIKRYFYDVGDRIGGDQLTAALAHVTDPDVDRETRQQILNDLEPYSRSDPAIEGQIQNLLYLGLSFLLPGGLPRAPKGAPKSPTIPERRAVEPSPTERATAIDTAYGYTPAQIWNLGFTTRGQIIHEIFGDGSLPPLFRIIDKLDFATGEATSIKSIDVRAATYQDANRFMNRVNAYVNRLTEYEGGLLQNVQVDLSQMTERILELIVPKGHLTAMHRAVIDAAKVRAQTVGTYPVRIIVKEF
jgi:hypothetical protein